MYLYHGPRGLCAKGASGWHGRATERRVGGAAPRRADPPGGAQRGYGLRGRYPPKGPSLLHLPGISPVRTHSSTPGRLGPHQQRSSCVVGAETGRSVRRSQEHHIDDVQDRDLPQTNHVSDAGSVHVHDGRLIPSGRSRTEELGPHAPDSLEEAWHLRRLEVGRGGHRRGRSEGRTSGPSVHCRSGRMSWEGSAARSEGRHCEREAEVLRITA